MNAGTKLIHRATGEQCIVTRVQAPSENIEAYAQILFPNGDFSGYKLADMDKFFEPVQSERSTEAKVDALMQVVNDHVRTLHILRQQQLGTAKWMREVKEAHATTRAAVALIVA